MEDDSAAPTFPARLHVLLAAKSHQAVVVRRGPAKSVCLVGWDRKSDTFEEGQWLRGRVYERRCDLSPDGAHFIYFAMNGHWGSETGGSWTAISRPPWLRAIVLLGKGDCWNGGGFFTGPGKYWLNDGYGHKVMRNSRAVTRDNEDPRDCSYGGECPGVYYHRLRRDGWSIGAHEKLESRHQATIFEKSLPRGWVLRKLAHEQIGSDPGRGCYWDSHELENVARGIKIECPDWEWAEFDGGELLFAEAGCLYRVSRPKDERLPEPKLIHDFNSMKFEARAAPYR